MGSPLNARQQVLDMIQKAAKEAAEKGVAVKVEYDEFGFDGRITATVTATPSSTRGPTDGK